MRSADYGNIYERRGGLTSTNETDLLDKIVGNTQSELILFFVIIVVAMVIVLLPLYSLMSKDRKQKNQLENVRQDKFIEREKQIIQVITANTEVMAGLKTTLEATGLSTTASLERIYERINNQSAKFAEIGIEMAQIKTTLERAISNQKDMADKLNKTLLIVDNIPNTSNFSAKNEAMLKKDWL